MLRGWEHSGLRKSSNLVAFGVVGAVALAGCNQLFSIEEPTPSSSTGDGGTGTLDGGGGSSGSTSTTHATTDSGGSGGGNPDGGATSSSGGTDAGSSMGGSSDSSMGGSGGSTNRQTTNDTTGGGSGGSGSGDNSTGGASSTGSASSTSGATSMGGATSMSVTASMTATTGVIDPPGPCEGEDLRGPALVEIPAGTGVIGSGVEDDNAFPVIHPDFDVFCIDETEVTVAQYQECVEDEGCDPPRDDLPGQCPEATPRPDNHPVGCVDYERAAQYCDWAGKRLPTEQEWEYAARGDEGRRYPWGEQALDSTRLNWNGVVGATTAVKSYPDGATPEGVYDMAGNVWEWTSSTWCSDYSMSPAECLPDVYVPRGGSYVSADRFVNPSYRDGDNEPDQRFGFRCAY